jgi:hypothetical protein
MGTNLLLININYFSIFTKTKRSVKIQKCSYCDGSTQLLIRELSEVLLVNHLWSIKKIRNYQIEELTLLHIRR